MLPAVCEMPGEADAIPGACSPLTRTVRGRGHATWHGQESPAQGLRLVASAEGTAPKQVCTLGPCLFSGAAEPKVCRGERSILPVPSRLRPERRGRAPAVAQASRWEMIRC